MAENLVARMPALPSLSVDQVAILVDDLDSAVERYARTFAIPRWDAWTYDRDLMANSTFRGNEGQFAMRLALGGTAPQVELIEPIYGPSIYHEHVAENGFGLHHVGCVVESVELSGRSMLEAGYELIQSGAGYGKAGDGAFSYFDTRQDYGLVIELIERPAERRIPEQTWDFSV